MNKPVIAFAALVFLAPASAFATRTWSGFLVNSSCYESEERNTNPSNTEAYVNKDRDAEVRYCSPSLKTKFFTFVDHDGLSFTLDPAGNAKAAEVVRQTGKKRVFQVTVSGEKNNHEIQVDSILAIR